MSSDVANPAPVRAVIRTHRSSLSPAEAIVAEHVLRDPHAVISQSIERFASDAGVSTATIVRTVQRFGFEGFGAFKIALARDLGGFARMLPTAVEPHDDPTTVTRKVIQAHVDALQQTSALVDPAALTMALEVLDAASVVEVYGVGSSASIAMDAYYRLRRIGMPVALVLDAHMQAVSASRLAPGAVALVISHTGRTPETLEAARLAEAAGATVVALTSASDTPLTGLSEIVLLTAPSESALGAEAMTSRLAHLALIDALCVNLALRRKGADIAAAVTDAIIAAKRRA